MSFRADIVLRGCEGRVVAIVEVKNRPNLTPADAAIIRRNLTAEGISCTPVFFLIVSQEVGYLWKGSHQYHDTDTPLEAEPDYQFPMQEVFARYFSKETPMIWLREAEFSLVLLQWLSDMSRGLADVDKEPQRALAQIGFVNAVCGAYIGERVQV